MPYAKREFRCPACGELIHRRAPQDAVKYCAEHAIARSIDNMRQMMNKPGPDYDKWRARTALSQSQMTFKYGPVYRRYLAGMAAWLERETGQASSDASVSQDAFRFRP